MTEPPTREQLQALADVAVATGRDALAHTILDQVERMPRKRLSAAEVLRLAEPDSGGGK
jgi:hypothetical protein